MCLRYKYVVNKEKYEQFQFKIFFCKYLNNDILSIQNRRFKK